MSKVTNREVKMGYLYFTLDDLQFKVRHHPGRDAIRTKRQVSKSLVPQMAEFQTLQHQIESGMSDPDKKQLTELREKLLALEGVTNEVTEKLTAEVEALLQKYDNPEAQAKVYSRLAENLDIDEEAILDALLFKHTEVKGTGFPGYVPLSNDVYFDQAFIGPRAEYIEIVRAEVVAFNGFLGNTAASQAAQAET